MDWSVVIPVVVANAVAIVVALMAWAQNKRTLEQAATESERALGHARILNDLEAVRTVLDAAASKLDAVGSSLFRVGYMPYVVTAADSERLETDLDGSSDLRMRLTIRFGEQHEVVQAYSGAESAAVAALADMSIPVMRQIEDSLLDEFLTDEEKQSLKGRWEWFETQQKLFLTLAQQSAGARLEPSDSA